MGRSCPNEPLQLHKTNIEISGFCKSKYFYATSLFSNLSELIINNFVYRGYQVRVKFNETAYGHGLTLREVDRLFERPPTMEMVWDSFVREAPKLEENRSDGVRSWQQSLRGSLPMTPGLRLVGVVRLFFSRGDHHLHNTSNIRAGQNAFSKT